MVGLLEVCVQWSVIVGAKWIGDWSRVVRLSIAARKSIWIWIACSLGCFPLCCPVSQKSCFTSFWRAYVSLQEREHAWGGGNHSLFAYYGRIGSVMLSTPIQLGPSDRPTSAIAAFSFLHLKKMLCSAGEDVYLNYKGSVLPSFQKHFSVLSWTWTTRIVLDSPPEIHQIASAGSIRMSAF